MPIPIRKRGDTRDPALMRDDIPTPERRTLFQNPREDLRNDPFRLNTFTGSAFLEEEARLQSAQRIRESLALEKMEALRIFEMNLPKNRIPGVEQIDVRLNNRALSAEELEASRFATMEQDRRASIQRAIVANAILSKKLKNQEEQLQRSRDREARRFLRDDVRRSRAAENVALEEMRRMELAETELLPEAPLVRMSGETPSPRRASPIAVSARRALKRLRETPRPTPPKKEKRNAARPFAARRAESSRTAEDTAYLRALPSRGRSLRFRDAFEAEEKIAEENAGGAAESKSSK